MANAGFSAPVDLVFAMGETEKKIDMTLDEIIRMSKKKGKKARAPARDMPKNLFRQRAKPSSLRSSFFSRLSALRQVKLAQARDQNGSVTFPTTEVVARKALSIPRTSRRRRSNRKFPRRFPSSYAAAAGKMKISVTNVATKNGARTLPVGYRRALAFGQLGVASSKVEVNYRPKLRTLDSLFANLKEQRAMQAQSGAQGFQKRSIWLGN